MPGAAENRYCNVQVRTWNDPDFLALSDRAKLLWLYFLSGIHTTRVPGVLAGGPAAMAEELGWSREDFDRSFAEIAAPRDGKEPMAIADWKARIVYLPSSFELDCNMPKSTSVIVAWRKAMNDLPDCDLLYRIDHDLRGMLRGMEKAQIFLDSYEQGKRRDQKRPSAVLPARLPAPSLDLSPDPALVLSPRPESGARARVDEVPSREPTTAATPASSAEVLREWNAQPGAPPFEDEAKIAPLAEAVRKLQVVSPDLPPLPELLGALYRVGKRMSDDGRQQVWQASTLVRHLQEAVLVARGQVKPEERSRAGPRRIDPLKGQMPIVHFNLDKG